MLVCSVSLRPPRTGAGITAGITEAAAAADSLGAGNVVFSTLVDDPASVRETVNAYLGEIMVEAVVAAAVVDAGLAYAAAIVEAMTAASLQDAVVVGVIPAVPRTAMLPSAFVNSDGTVRDANVDGVMVNL